MKQVDKNFGNRKDCILQLQATHVGLSEIVYASE